MLRLGIPCCTLPLHSRGISLKEDARLVETIYYKYFTGLVDTVKVGTC